MQAKPLFTPRQAMHILLVSGLLWFGAYVVMFLFCGATGTVDCPITWPVSLALLFIPDGDGGQIQWPLVFAQMAIPVTLSIGMFYVIVRRVVRQGLSLPLLALAAFALISLTNLYKGIELGYVASVDEADLLYYPDALDIDDPLTFIRQFETIQPSLRTHSRTHPPGAVLVYHALHRLGLSPALMALTIAATATVLTLTALNQVLKRTIFQPEHDPRLRQYVLFLFFLLPAIQVYFLSSVDALVTAGLTWTLALYLHPNRWVAGIGAALVLALTSTLTFGFLFLLPVLLGIVLWQRDRWLPFVLVIGGLGLFYGLLLVLLDYNYLHSFSIASRLENPDGFRLLSEPSTYFATRLENIAEIIFFFGPFLCLVFVRGLRHVRRQTIYLVLLAIGTLLLVFLTGAYRTGETARAAGFIYPYLFLPVAGYLLHIDVSDRARTQLAIWVFAQTVLMQVVFWFLW